MKHGRRPWPHPVVLFLLLLSVLLVGSASASRGDRSYSYKECFGLCNITQCGRLSADYAKTQPWTRRWTGWSCSDDCSYECQQKLTDRALANQRQRGLPKGRMVQFFGKWPFRRFLGIQEPFSVLFSIANLYAHWRWLRPMRRVPSSLPPALRSAYRWMPVVGVNTWVWSILYHTRDYPWSERMDYFSAALSTLFWLYHAILRLSGLYTDDSTQVVRSRRMLQAVFTLAFIAHCGYLTFWKFDYGYNMAFNLLVGGSHNLLWYLWAARLHTRAETTPSHVDQHVVTLTLFAAFTLLEVLDFQPWLRAIDAHALWHLSTIPVIGRFYEFHWSDARSIAAGEQPQQWQQQRDSTSETKEGVKEKQ